MEESTLFEEQEVYGYVASLYRVDPSFEWNASPLHDACNRCDLDEMARILSESPETDSRDFFGRTVMHHAVQNLHVLPDSQRRKDVVWALVRARANLNVQDALGMTPLHLAIKTSNQTPLNTQEWCIRFLLRNGANPWIRENTGLHGVDIALLRCNEHSFPTLLNYLLTCFGAKDPLRACAMRHILSSAIEMSNFECLVSATSFAKSCYGGFDYVTPTGTPLLTHALQSGSGASIVRFLVNTEGVDVFGRDGVDPLQFCIDRRDEALVKSTLVRQLEGLQLPAVMKRLAGVVSVLIEWMTYGSTEGWTHACDAHTVLEILCQDAAEDMREADRLLTLLKFARNYNTDESGNEGALTLIDTCRAVGLPLPVPGAVSRF